MFFWTINQLIVNSSEDINIEKLNTCLLKAINRNQQLLDLENPLIKYFSEKW